MFDCAITYLLSSQHSLIVLHIFSVLTQMFRYFTGRFSSIEVNDILLQDPHEYSIGEELATKKKTA